MVSRAGRIAMLSGALLAALTMPAWAGSSQAALSVGVVVPARCAVRMPETVAPADLPGAGPREAVAMRCTKGALPSGPGGIRTAGAVGPQITRSFVLPATGSPAAVPRPLSETGPIAGPETHGPRMVITVNF
jgi:hypothetical protein